MLLWIVLVIFIAGIIVSILQYKCVINTEPLGGILTFTSGIILSIMLFFMFSVYITATSDRLTYEQRYNLLLEESTLLSTLNEDSITYTKFITDIKEWNEDIVYCKELQRDFWVGIFIPNIYDFEVINIKIRHGK